MSTNDTARPHDPQQTEPTTAADPLPASAQRENAQAQPETAQPETAQPDPAAHAPATPQRTSTLAVVSLVVAFFVGLGGIVLGIVALVQLKRTGQRGRGLAIAGIVVGGVQLAVATVIGLLLATGIALAVSTAGAATSGLDSSAGCGRLASDLAEGLPALQQAASTLEEDPQATLDAVSEFASQLDQTVSGITDPEVGEAASDLLDEVRATEYFLQSVVADQDGVPATARLQLLEHVTDVVEALNDVKSVCTAGE